MSKIIITGGAGYVGSLLTRALVERKHEVTVFDTFWFWDSPKSFLEKTGLTSAKNLKLVQGDIRSKAALESALKGSEIVIQLACISNDPSSDLNPDFTHSVNYDGNLLVIETAKRLGVPKFIYASSSSVYGVKAEPNVTEEMTLEPLTQYSKLKVEIEKELLKRLDEHFKAVIIRPSTVCGYSPRQRLDVVVNLLTDSALHAGKVKVFGGEQLRPNIHIGDMVDLYVQLCEMDFDRISGKIFNAGWDNLKVREIAELVSNVIGNIPLEYVSTNDNRSYHVSSQKISSELGFESNRSVKNAIEDLVGAFMANQIPAPSDSRYHNVRRLKEILAKDA
jgi:nucleoside-diphosphate-sugar epimerase